MIPTPLHVFITSFDQGKEPAMFISSAMFWCPSCLLDFSDPEGKQGIFLDTSTDAHPDQPYWKLGTKFFRDNPGILQGTKGKKGAGKVAQLIRYLLCKHEDLNSMPRTNIDF